MLGNCWREIYIDKFFSFLPFCMPTFKAPGKITSTIFYRFRQWFLTFQILFKAVPSWHFTFPTKVSSVSKVKHPPSSLVLIKWMTSTSSLIRAISDAQLSWAELNSKLNRRTLLSKVRLLIQASNSVFRTLFSSNQVISKCQRFSKKGSFQWRNSRLSYGWRAAKPIQIQIAVLNRFRHRTFHVLNSTNRARLMKSSVSELGQNHPF